MDKFNNLNVPVLLLVFNRLDVTSQVFAQIRQAKPLRLYIASDGPRCDRDGEAVLVANLRQYLLDRLIGSVRLKHYSEIQIWGAARQFQMV